MNKPGDDKKPDTNLARGLIHNQALSLGTTVAVGVIVIVLPGYLMDRRTGNGFKWTMVCLVLGILYAGYEVWKAVRWLNRQPPEKPHNDDSH